MPLRTEAVCDRCGRAERFGEKQNFPDTPPPDWYGMKLTQRMDDTYEFSWGLLCRSCYTQLREWMRNFKPFSAEGDGAEEPAAAPADEAAPPATAAQRAGLPSDRTATDGPSDPSSHA